MVAFVELGCFWACFAGRRDIDVEVGRFAAGVRPGLSADVVSFDGA